MSFLIRQSLVLTMEPGGPPPTTTGILIDEDRIVAIGRDLPAPDPRQCEVIDGRGMIALPGFVNADAPSRAAGGSRG